MSIPISQFIPPIPTIFPSNFTFVFYICDSISVLYLSSFVPYFKILHLSDVIQYFSFSMTYFTQYDNL